MKDRSSFAPKLPVVVIGASGTMGGAAVESLLSRAARVRVLTRSLDRVAHLPRSVERVVGDAANRADVERVLDRARGVFLVCPHSKDDELLTRNVTEKATDAGIRLVFAGVHVDGGSRLVRALMRTAFSLRIPQYSGKFRAGELARRVPNSVVLMPTNFCQNDEVFRRAILAGTFPEPIGLKGFNRVDCRDIGDAAARALLDDALPGGAYPVVGPASLTGPECAAVWAEALGREVTYTGDSDDWMDYVKSELEGQKQADYLASFGFMKSYALPTIVREVAQTTSLLGRPPRTYKQYVDATLERWREARAA